MATRAGSDGNASVKTQRQLGTGALAAAPSRGEWDREFETCHASLAVELWDESRRV
jgi:hypothetical protein